jgi:curli biogenesis system outer membrane secretion channel CsgG
MRKLTASICTLAAVIAVATMLAPSRVHAQANRPTVALLDLDFGTVQRWWDDNYDIGKGIADLIVDAMLEDGSFRVFERKKLASVLGEQDLSNSNRADPDAKTVAKLGKVAGVKYLVTGSITKFGTEDSKKGVGGGGFGGGKFGLGGVGMSKGKATVAITVRVIDTSTSEIMMSAKGEGVSKRSGLMLGGGSGGGGGGGFGGFQMGSSNFRETVIGEATELAVKQLVTNLVAKKGNLQ